MKVEGFLWFLDFTCSTLYSILDPARNCKGVGWKVENVRIDRMIHWRSITKSVTGLCAQHNDDVSQIVEILGGSIKSQI